MLMLMLVFVFFNDSTLLCSCSQMLLIGCLQLLRFAVLSLDCAYTLIFVFYVMFWVIVELYAAFMEQFPGLGLLKIIN